MIERLFSPSNSNIHSIINTKLPNNLSRISGRLKEFINDI